MAKPNSEYWGRKSFDIRLKYMEPPGSLAYLCDDRDDGYDEWIIARDMRIKALNKMTGNLAREITLAKRHHEQLKIKRRYQWP